MIILEDWYFIIESENRILISWTKKTREAYDDGHGVEQNSQSAFEWFMKTAEKGELNI